MIIDVCFSSLEPGAQVHFNSVRCSYVVNFLHFRTSAPNSMNPEKVLYLLGGIQNPRWLPWCLIVRDIFNFFFRTFVCEVTRLFRSVVNFQ